MSGLIGTSSSAAEGSSAYQTLRFEVVDGVAIATFTTPQQLNALTEQRMDELEAVIDEVQRRADIGALVLHGGEGKAFCVGLDLDLLDKAFAHIPYFMQVVTRLAGLIARLEALPVPTIAAVNGFARAGGFELALACDFLLMADEGLIGDAHTDAGVLPAASSLRLKRRVGEQRAKEVIWTARWYTGPEAVAIGLALRSVPRAALRAEAQAFALTLTDKPRACIAANKSVYQRGVDATLAEGVAIELQVFEAYMGGEPHGREGYTAYREGRPPSWKTRPDAL